jgi:protein TonB
LAWVVGSVLLAHLAALWALQSGLLQRAVEVLVPVVMVADLSTPPPKVQAVQTPPAQTKPIPPPKTQAVTAAQPVPPQPQPVNAVAPDPSPAAHAPMAVAAAPKAMPAPVGANTVASTSMNVGAAVTAPLAPASPAPPKLELPSSDADYLQNTRPAYPAMSKRLGEQGKVLVRVLIGVDGTARQAEVQKSSGFDRLDQAALATVQRWRYVPGKRGGVAEAMWFTVPLVFVLE